MATVRAAITQTTWTGDKASMLDKHEGFARDAAADGAQVICFQELFYGPYFCQVQDPQYYSYTEKIPDGPTTKRMQALAKEIGGRAVACDVTDDASVAALASAVANGYIYAMLNALLLVSADLPDRAS